MKLLKANNYLDVEGDCRQALDHSRSVSELRHLSLAGFVIKRRDGGIRLDKSSPTLRDQ